MRDKEKYLPYRDYVGWHNVVQPFKSDFSQIQATRDRMNAHEKWIEKYHADRYAKYGAKSRFRSRAGNEVTGPGPSANKSRQFATKSSFPQNDRGRKRQRSEDLSEMVRNYRRRTPVRSRSRGRSRNRRPATRSRSRSVYSVRRGGGLRRSRNYPRRRRSLMRMVRRRRTRPMMITDPAKHGASLVVERSGVISSDSPQALYIGHGVSTEQFWVNVCRAIIRKLFRILGQEVTDWNHSVAANIPSTPFAIQIGYSTAVNPSSILLDSTDLPLPVLPATLTYNGVADLLYQRFNAILSATDNNITIYHVLLFDKSDNLDTVARLDMSNVVLEYKVTSILKIQNASLAGTQAGDLEDENRENITRNPLVGKLYYKKTRANGFKLQTAPLQGQNVWANNVITVANRSTGMILWNTQTGNSVDFLLKFKKPPAGHMFQAQSKPYGISPGSIKEIKWTDTRKIKFHKLIEICKNTFVDNAGEGIYQTLGKVQMLGLEKKLNAISNENPIVVHWALEQHYSHVIKKTIGIVPRIQQIVDPS